MLRISSVQLLTHFDRRYPFGKGCPRSRLHRYHRVALLTPFVLFPLPYFLPWNPIYAGITAALAGAVATVLCRPDLAWKISIGGAFFLGYYLVFMLALEWTAPGYIARVWNLGALSGVTIQAIPLE